MNEENLKSVSIQCPHCGHNTFLDIDASEGSQDYQEECSACGDLIHVSLQVDEVSQQAHIKVDGNDEQFY